MLRDSMCGLWSGFDGLVPALHLERVVLSSRPVQLPRHPLLHGHAAAYQQHLRCRSGSGGGAVARWRRRRVAASRASNLTLAATRRDTALASPTVGPIMPDSDHLQSI
eukprot:365736-Chlamydomonas_euryale.AAC.3